MHVQSFCDALTALGHNVLLLSQQDSRTHVNNARAMVEQIPVRKYPFRGAARVFRIMFAKTLSNILKDGEYEAVYLRVSPCSRIMKVLNKADVLACFEINGLAWLHQAEKFQTLPENSVFFTDSSVIKRYMHEAWGLDPKRIVINPNCGVDAEIFSSSLKRRNPKDKCITDPRVFHIGHMSSFRDHHDFHTILEAVERLTFPSCLVFCGHGSRFDEIKTECKRRGIVATFTGSLPHHEAIRSMSSMDVCLNAFHKWNQQIGNLRAFKTYEYMACGVPVVDTVDPALPIPDWASAHLGLVPYEDPEAMAAAITEIKENKESWEKRAGAARQWVFENMTWEQIARNAVQVIEEAK